MIHNLADHDRPDFRSRVDGSESGSGLGHEMLLSIGRHGATEARSVHLRSEGESMSVSGQASPGVRREQIDLFPQRAERECQNPDVEIGLTKNAIATSRDHRACWNAEFLR